MNRFARLPCDVDAMLAEARTATGIDRVDETAAEPLRIFCESVNHDGRLTVRGAIDLDRFLHRVLVNRLRMQRDFERHPEIREQPLEPPIIICGVNRTGSTKTHRMLSASGDFNWLPLWQGLNPALVGGDRHESPEPRVRDAERFAAWYAERAPEMPSIHELDAHEPEEETFVLVNSLCSPVLTGMVEAPAYIAWLMAGGAAPQFTFLADVLRYLQWQGLADPGKRWLLKSPFYSGLESQLLQVFPGARLIMTHRHPSVTVPSTCSLFACFRKPYTDASIDARAVLMGLAIPTQLHLQFRQTLPEDAFLDLHFRDIVADPEPLVRAVYAHCGQALTRLSLERVLQWDRDHPQNRHGRHRYSLQSFGLAEADIDTAFADYLHFLARRFPQHAESRNSLRSPESSP